MSALWLVTLALLPTAGPGPRGLPGAERYRDCVRTCLDNILKHGTDRYGEQQTPMVMSIVDVRTGESPRTPELLDGYIRSEERPGRRNPGGCDLWDDQPLLRTLYAFGSQARDSRYATAADAYVAEYFRLARQPNDLLAWGSHRYYDAYADRIADDGHGAFHEILIHHPCWDRMWEVTPGGVRREVELIWKWHIVDCNTGQHNRHDDARPGCDFAFSGGSFALAFAFLYSKTHDPVWLERAKTVVGWHWSHRDPTTSLVPDAPSTGDRYDAHHCFTTVAGPFAAMVLRCYELTRDPFFREVALGCIKAYLKYGWDPDARQFHAMLTLDGKPVRDQEKGPGYDRWMPTGYVDVWPTTMYSYEFPLIAGQACLYGYRLTKDRELLDGARKWAANIRGALPPAIGRRWRDEILAAMPEAARKGGAYADGYGRAISFFLHLHYATRDPADLETAVSLADEAVSKLYENGWVKGHAGKPYYEATDGVGVLLYALLELSDFPRRMPDNL